MGNRCTARSPFIFLLAIAFVAGQWGCAHTTPKVDSIPSKPLLGDLGTVGIVSSRAQPEMNLKKPKGKLAGAAMGAGAIVGGVLGAFEGESSKKIKETEATLHEALTGLRIQEIMRDLIYMKAKEKALSSLVLIEDMGPIAPDENADYLPLKEQGINTVLEVRVLIIGLLGEVGINPLLTFFMTANAKYIRVDGNHDLYDRTFRFEGASRKFVEWGLNNGEAFRKEFEEGCHFPAEEVAEELGSRSIALPPSPGSRFLYPAFSFGPCLLKLFSLAPQKGIHKS